MPAFGVTMRDFERLRAIGCLLVDTTCGSVLNVWKRVEAYARDGYTAIIHGKHWHEETKATASQVTRYPGGRYLVVLDMEEARLVLAYIEHGGDAAALAEQFGKAASPGFDFARDLERVGIANQTTMLSGESLAIAAEFGRAMERRYGAEARSSISGASIRSARRRRSGRTRWSRCWRAARRHAGDRRVQLEQHLSSGRALRRAGSGPITSRTRAGSIRRPARSATSPPAASRR